MTHRLNLFLLVLAVLIGVPYYVLLLHNPSRDIAPHPLHMADLRRLAGSVPGPLPQSIQGTIVAWDRTPGNLLAAGSGIKRRLYTVISFRIDAPGRGPIIIDTGTTVQLAGRQGIESFREASQQRVDADIAEASLILATDESPDALGGLTRLAGTPQGTTALAKAQLAAAQTPQATRSQGLPWPAGLTLPAAIGNAPRAVAPGVVVIPAGAPSPGSQMIYVRLADGSDYLFAGGVAPYGINATQLRTRSRLLDWWDGRADRDGAMRWLVTIWQWHNEVPDLFIVPGHEGMALADKDRPSSILLRE